jgi:hypothetical protein
MHERLVVLRSETDRALRHQLSVEMFEYMCQQVDILKQCHKYLEALGRKLCELHYIDGWDQAGSFYRRLLGHRMPLDL